MDTGAHSRRHPRNQIIAAKKHVRSNVHFFCAATSHDEENEDMDDSVICEMPPALPLEGTELVPIFQTGMHRCAEAAAFGVPVVSAAAPPPRGQFQTWIDDSVDPPMLKMYIGASWVPLYAIYGSGNISLAASLNVSGGANFTGGVALPNGSASSPSAVWNTNSGLFWDTTNAGLGISIGGAQIGYLASGLVRFSHPGGASNQFNIQGESLTNVQLETYSASANTAGNFSRRRGHGTIASPSVPVAGDTIGNDNWQVYTGAGFTNAGRIVGVLTETSTVDATHVGFQWRFYACPIGTGTLTEVARLDNESGLSMFGANPVIDNQRAIRPRSTTIAGAVTPAHQGAIYFHSDAQGGAGEIAIDTGSAYRHPGQAALKHLTAADEIYTPRVDGRIVRDSVVLSADHSLTLSTTNATDGYAIKISRRGSSGGHNRNVYQADGVTLIVALADNASADVVYDAAAGSWFEP